MVVQRLAFAYDEENCIKLNTRQKLWVSITFSNSLFPPPPLVARTDQDSKWVFQRFSSFQSSRNLCIFFYRVSVCRFIQVSWLTVRYVIVVFSLFGFTCICFVIVVHYCYLSQFFMYFRHNWLSN